MLAIKVGGGITPGGRNVWDLSGKAVQVVTEEGVGLRRGRASHS